MNKTEFEIENGELIKYHGDGSDVVIPDGVTRIGDFAFSWCETVTSVTIPASVTEISYLAMNPCPNLAVFRVAPEHPAFRTADGVLYSADGTRLVCCPRTRTGRFVIPEGVTEIAGGAFASCGALSDVVIPDGVTDIGEEAFRGCRGLTCITLPAGLRSIGDSAFSWCEGLTSVTIPEGVQHIGGYAFNECKALTAISLPESVTRARVSSPFLSTYTGAWAV